MSLSHLANELQHSEKCNLDYLKGLFVFAIVTTENVETWKVELHHAYQEMLTFPSYSYCINYVRLISPMRPSISSGTEWRYIYQ